MLSPSSNLRKVNILLKAIDAAGKNVDYYALDLSQPELERTLSAVPPGTFKHVSCYGLYGTYDDGLAWLKTPAIREKPKTVLSLGSSIGNFSRPDAAGFLHNFAEVLKGPHDALLIGLDGCKDHDTVYAAYNDKEGVTRRFYENGLLNANRILGYDAFDLKQWDIVGEYKDVEGRHEAFIVPREAIVIEGAKCRSGEKIRIEEAYKYSDQEAHQLWSDAGLQEKHIFRNDSVKYGKHDVDVSFLFPMYPAFDRSLALKIRSDLCMWRWPMCCRSYTYETSRFLVGELEKLTI